MLRVIVLVAALLTALPAHASDPIAPDRRLTPGAILTSDASAICQPGYTKTVRHTSGRLKGQIYRE
jgi:hypothetical protein